MICGPPDLEASLLVVCRTSATAQVNADVKHYQPTSAPHEHSVPPTGAAKPLRYLGTTPFCGLCSILNRTGSWSSMNVDHAQKPTSTFASLSLFAGSGEDLKCARAARLEGNLWNYR